MNEEQVSAQIAIEKKISVNPDSFFHNRLTMQLVMGFSDIIALALAWVFAVIIRFILVGMEVPQVFYAYSYFLPLAILVYVISGLYNHNLSEVEELRRLTISTSIYFLVLFSLIYFFRQSEIVSRLTIILAWVFSIILVPLLREIFRNILVKFGLWGEPVIIFGNGLLGNEVADYLRSHPQMGYIPIGVIDRRKEDRKPSKGLKVVHSQAITSWQKDLPEWIKNVRTAFFVTPETDESMREMVIEKQTIRFEKMILVRSPERCGSLWVQPIDIGGIVGLEVGQNLLNKSQILTKRIVDLILLILSLPFLLPLFGVVALLIKLDDGGDIFYYQDRIGYGGKTFKLWKFRSMCNGAEEKLVTFLDANPDKKAEFEVNHKLLNDPRVTRAGKFLRKTSIDEFPQLINVIKGEMSLVGPRPFLANEIGFYDKCYSLYTYVQPGITGLWQISGRSNVSYDTRVSLDDYYLRNWSIWLDIHILIRTGLVVLRGRGSY